MKLAKFIASTAILLTACDKPMKKIDVENNTNPRMRYQVTMKINKSPGLFKNVTGSMLYKIENKLCIPESPISGVRVGRNEYRNIELKNVSKDTYIGEVYFDLLKGEDYFGLGTCYWTPNALTITMEANGNTFYAGISASSMQSGNPESTYFNAETYESSNEPREIGGASLNENIKKHIDKFFSVTMTGKEIF